MILGGEVQHPAGFGEVFPFVDFIEGFFHLVGGDIGKESQPSGIDAQDGNLFFSYTACRTQERSVASDAKHHVGIERVSLKNLQAFQVGFRVLLQEVVEIVADAYLGFFAAQDVKQMGDVRRFMFLVCIPEKGKSEDSLHIL